MHHRTMSNTELPVLVVLTADNLKEILQIFIFLVCKFTSTTN